MEKTKIFTLTFSVFLLLNSFSYSQDFGFECGMNSNDEQSLTTGVTNGELKPVRSDMSGGNIIPEPNGMYFPILIICVQFKDETDDNEHLDWRAGQDPTFITNNELITPYKVNSGNWWERYTGYAISDWWQQVSCGKMHVLGRAYSIKLDYTAAEYLTITDILIRQRTINRHIWEKVEVIPGFDWSFYDKWGKENGQWVFGNGNNYIDMIYKIHRTNPAVNGNYVLPHYEGYGYLSFDVAHNNGDTYIYDITNTNYHIAYNFTQSGSGLTLQGHDRSNYFMSKSAILNLAGHEHGHFFLGSGDHIRHAKMNLGTSRDFFYSPWERIKFGYIIPYEFDFINDNPVQIINDFSARDNSHPIIMQIPIRITANNKKEFFLITSRRKISPWDKFMQGDTAKTDFLREIHPRLGKGVYIYHVPNELEYGSGNPTDLECADGLWNWTFGGPRHPYWTFTGTYDYIYRNTVDYDHNDVVNGGMNNVDDISVSYIASDHTSSNIFSLGKTNTCTDYYESCNEATDRIYTNNNHEVWTSWEYMGDRYDAWEVGYNEIFSPYSSPSTRNWNHGQTGIFIWYKNISETNQATIEIHKADPDSPESLMEMCVLTPPSRPMGIKMEEYYEPYPSTICHPKIVWGDLPPIFSTHRRA